MQEDIKMRECVETLPQMADRLTDIMLEITGCSREDMLRTRKFPCPSCRAMIYRELRKDGFTASRIGRYFDYDHSTIICADKKLADMLETKDREVTAIYENFQNRLRDENIGQENQEAESD